MSTVIPIHGGPIGGEPNGDLIAELEQLLKRAVSGEVQALACAYVLRDGQVLTGWHGSGGTRFPLGCAISCLQYRYYGSLECGCP